MPGPLARALTVLQTHRGELCGTDEQRDRMLQDFDDAVAKLDAQPRDDLREEHPDLVRRLSPTPFDDVLRVLEDHRDELAPEERERNHILRSVRDLGTRLYALRREPLSKARADLIRRLFPVAISVGFASSLVGMSWLKQGAFPRHEEVEQLFRLLAAMAVILLGWEWYNRDIETKPHGWIGKFFLDVLVVFVGLVLLVSSAHDRLSLLSLLVTFVLYVVWDWLSIYEYPAEYQLAAQRAHWWIIVPEILTIYQRGCRDAPGLRGPITNLCWLLYFVIIIVSSFFIFPSIGRVFVTCAFVTAGAIGLWHDGNSGPLGDRGYGMNERTIKIARILIAYAICLLAAWLFSSSIPALEISEAQITGGRLVVGGRISEPHQEILLDGTLYKETSGFDGAFKFSVPYLPPTCMVDLSTARGHEKDILVANCSPRGAMGPRGFWGFRGPTGDRGAQGDKGNQGIAGIEGPKGPKGDPGRDGDSALLDEASNGMKLCGLQQRRNAAPSFSIVVPKTWTIDTCRELYFLRTNVTQDIRPGCMFADQPAVRWAEQPPTSRRAGLWSFSAGGRTCGW